MREPRRSEVRRGALYQPPRLAAWTNERFVALLILAFAVGVAVGGWIVAGARP